MDATMWQTNERKARFIAAALSGDRTIRTIDDIGETANQFALAKAIASGDARLMQKAGLEGEIARLERQRAAHFDDQLAVRRRIANAQGEIETARRRVEQIGRDLKQRVPTRGDAFVLHAKDGRQIDDRRTAGAHLLTRGRLIEKSRTEGKVSLGTLGGFELACEAGPTWRREFEARLILRRTGLDQEIETEHDITPLGLIARIEHILERMGQDRQEQQHQALDAERRLLGYQDRV